MEMVTFTVVANQLEAEQLAGLLRTNGIDCTFRASNTSAGAGTFGGGVGMAGPTEVLVRESDVEAARELLGEVEEP
jgi:Putative prokaryotic signal transducing protein